MAVDVMDQLTESDRRDLAQEYLKTHPPPIDEALNHHQPPMPSIARLQTLRNDTKTSSNLQLSL